MKCWIMEHYVYSDIIVICVKIDSIFDDRYITSYYLFTTKLQA